MERPREVRVSLLSAAILLYNIYLAANEKDIGFVDADKTLEDLVNEMSKDVWLKTSTLESAIYYANMLGEAEKMWHPYGAGFETFLRRMLPNELNLDRYYNIISFDKSKGS